MYGHGVITVNREPGRERIWKTHGYIGVSSYRPFDISVGSKEVLDKSRRSEFAGKHVTSGRSNTIVEFGRALVMHRKARWKGHELLNQHTAAGLYHVRSNHGCEQVHLRHDNLWVCRTNTPPKSILLLDLLNLLLTT